MLLSSTELGLSQVSRVLIPFAWSVVFAHKMFQCFWSKSLKIFKDFLLMVYWVWPPLLREVELTSSSQSFTSKVLSLKMFSLSRLETMMRNHQLQLVDLTSLSMPDMVPLSSGTTSQIHSGGLSTLIRSPLMTMISAFKPET